MNARTARAVAAAAMVLLLASAGCRTAKNFVGLIPDPMEQTQNEPQLVSAVGSERATSGGGNRIVTHGGKIHVVWQDARPEGYFNMVRSLDLATGEWTEPVTLNKAKDNHARPNLMVDHAGHLHAVMSGHGSPVTYRKSVRPNDTSEWTREETIGNGTYPILACGPDDSLYVTMRSARHWDGADLYVKRPGEAWKLQRKLVRQRKDLPSYAGYHAGLAFSPDGTLHCVVDFYESKGVYKGRGIHQAVCYLRSRDGGETWQKADGTPVGPGARPEDIDCFVQDENEKRIESLNRPVVLAQGCIVATDDNVPHVLYITHIEEPGRIMHAWADPDGTWHEEKIVAAEEAFPTHRAAACRGALTRDAAGNIYALLPLQPLGKGWKEGKPLRGLHFSLEAKRLVWLIRDVDTGKWSARLAMPAGADTNEANVERPTGVNMPEPDRLPPFLYFDGTSRYRKQGEILQNNVFFVR